MRAIIIYSQSNFPLSAIAGAVCAGNMPALYKKGTILALPADSPSIKRQSLGEPCFSACTPSGKRVVAFSSRSGSIIFKNLINSFPEIIGIKKREYSFVEIKPPSSLLFLIGDALIKYTPLARMGIKLIERHIKKIYPQLHMSIKLDCKFQISDNYTETCERERV
ncbi:MAG: DUF3189 family protein [Bacillota bacterium]